MVLCPSLKEETTMAIPRRGYYCAVAFAAPLSIVLATAAGAATPAVQHEGPAAQSGAQVEARVKPTIVKGNSVFKDLNANGNVDPYEDWHRSSQQRASDLISRMTLEEKAGMMHITS